MVEEISLRKGPNSVEATISDTVRKTEIKVEDDRSGTVLKEAPSDRPGLTLRKKRR